MKKIIISVLLLASVGFLLKNKIFKEQSFRTDLNLSVSRKVSSFDPAIAFNDNALNIIGQSLETLYQYHYLKRPYEIIPALADGMPKVSKDGMTYTFKIKKNISYHSHPAFNGKKRFVIAKDFINSIKRLAYSPLKSTGRWLFESKITGFDHFYNTTKNYKKFKENNISGLKAIDDQTLQIRLNRPEPNMLYFLAMTFTTPVPIELLDFTKNDLKNTIVGTGPFKFISSENQVYRMEKFLDFRKEHYPRTGDRYANTKNLLKSSSEVLPLISQVKFHIVNNDEDSWKMFINKKIDVLSVPKKFLKNVIEQNSKFYKKLKADGIEVKHFSRLASRWLGFNMKKGILAENPSLRKAIARAIDYDKYIEVLTQNTNLVANSIYNPSIPGYKPEHKNSFEYDILKAKDLMRTAGFPGGVGLPEITYSTRGTDPAQLDEAEFLKLELAKIGIKLKINILEFSEFLRLGRKNQLELWTDNWIYDYPDAENILQLLISKNSPGINKSGYSNKEVDNIYNKLAKTLDKQERFKLMYELENIVYEDLPWIPLMYESTYILHRSDIKNFRKSFFIRNYLKYIKRVSD